MQGKYFRKVADDAPERERVPPGQYLTNGFPVLTYGQAAEITTDSWQLKIWGAVERDSALSWDDMLALPQVTFTADFHCVTRWSKLDVTWTGVRLTDILSQLAISPEAKHVMQHCYGGYTTNLPLDDFLRPSNYLVHTLNGEPLSTEHGGPARTIIPHLYAWKSAKWIRGFEFLREEEAGFWERNGYHRRGDPWAEQRYSDAP